MNIRLDEDKLEPKEYIKYLDIYTDRKLILEKHIIIADSKLQKVIGIIKTIRHFIKKLS